MGEVLKFPGNFSGNNQERQSFVQEVDSVGDQNVSSILDRKPRVGDLGLAGLDPKVQQMLTRFTARLAKDLTTGGGRFRGDRHAMRRGIEEEWWEAHQAGDLEEQTRIESRIGGVFGVHRGPEIVNRLQRLAKIYEAQEKKHEGHFGVGPDKEI